ncbi:uncharacterized protein IL334_006695 [Kwoniella shivajii]|uniref:Rho termination factor N-terminal domain-containing protein n=1 Tax=Kwoniella shivajii TaxID=564305 RepID=A0ABZ1D709_9TREE|nr:hypothetical protein IL334_006695 [Kwoniella shivajii]
MHSVQCLQTLKVSQLKAICKELNISGYSKLNKAGLTDLILTKQSAVTDRPIPLGPGDIILTTTPVRQSNIEEPIVSTSTTKKRKTHSDEESTVPLSNGFNPTTSLVQITGALAPTTMTLLPPPQVIRAASHITQKRSAPAKVANHRFICPRVIRKVPQHATEDSKDHHTNDNNVTDAVLTSTSGKIDFLRAHFLETLCGNLESARRKLPLSEVPATDSSKIIKSRSTNNLAFQGFASSIYTDTSPESFMVAIRFWVSRLHAIMLMGSGEAWSAHGSGMGLLGPDLLKWPAVLSCKRLSHSVWSVTTSNEGIDIHAATIMTKYLVIGINGGVISSSNDEDSTHTVDSCPVRYDWFKFMADGSETSQNLLDHIKTKNVLEFPGGVSRTWQERVRNSQDRREMIEIAERAVLSSCVINSFSGTKMTGTEMDAQIVGCEPTIKACKSSGIAIYLPDGVTDIVLKDSGQSVGNEDNGVAELWQGLLGCDEKGKKDDSRTTEFWHGWQARTLC